MHAVSDVFFSKKFNNRCRAIAGIAKLAAREGTTVIGEIKARVSLEASKIPDAVTLKMPEFFGTTEQITSQMMTYNRLCILQEMISGRTFLDIGIDAS